MLLVTITYRVLLYTAIVICIVGLFYKVTQLFRAPVVLRIPAMPAPTSSIGVIGRVLREVVLFESLFLSDKWLWLFALLFHSGLLFTLLRHIRYFLEPDTGITWHVVVSVQSFRIYAAIIMLVGLIALLGRRLTLEPVRYITTVSDMLTLFLLLTTCTSGLLMTLIVHTDIIVLKRFFVNLSTFSLYPLPLDVLLLLHLFCVTILLIIFPISKLFHTISVFFSPTRNQCDSARKKIISSYVRHR